VAPVAAIRASASASVEQAMLVPALLTKGNAKDSVGAKHPETRNSPPTHCAKPPLTHACSPSWHGEFALRVANLAFNAWASWSFWRVKGLASAGGEAGGCGADLGGASLDVGAGADVDAGAGAGSGLWTLLLPTPLTPPVAPVAEIRASASCCVVQVILVPSLSTRWSAKHLRPAGHPLSTNRPRTH